MEAEEMRFICQSCGKEVEDSSGEPPCEVLKGWVTVSHWYGRGDVDHYTFCSFACLRSWVDAQVPQIPNIFLKSFDEGD
ncbi:MAG: hypothetical protein ACLFVK_07850 [Dehalococcoidia bacterium]